MLELVAFANKFHNRSKINHNCIIVFAYAPPEYTIPVVIVGVFYNSPAAEAEQFFTLLLALSPIANLTENSRASNLTSYKL
ncbi:FAD-linked oxidoreductase [Ilyonectria robusta]